MNILALDLSSKATGFCVYVDGKMKDYGRVASSSKDVIERIYIMREKIKELTKEYNIEKVVAEEVRCEVQNNRTQKVLFWTQAAIIFALYDIDPTITIEFLQPSEWRSMIGIHTGRGIKRKELKEADILHVKEKYDIETDDDTADAICIMEAYLKMLEPKPTGKPLW